MIMDRIQSAGLYAAEMLVGEGDFVTISAGFFVVFHPEDAHMPCLACGQTKPLRKVVIKLAVG